MKEMITYSLDTIDQVVEELHERMTASSIFTFTGPLGAGKTTLIKKLLARAGVEELVTSPTFTYVSIYTNNNGETFYHFDLYRLKTTTEFIEAGFDEYLDIPKSWVFVEWPDIIMPLLKHNICSVSLEYLSERERLFTCTSF